jgi:hypothetical protein
VNAQIFLPNNSQSKPSAGSSRTVEKEIGNSFLLTALAHHTAVSFIQRFLSSSQNIPRIQPIIEKQRSKKSDLWDTLGFPYTKDGSTRPELSELIMIEMTCQEPTLPPNEVPGVLGVRVYGGRLFSVSCKSRNSLYAALDIGILKQSNRLSAFLRVNKDMAGSRAKCRRWGNFSEWRTPLIISS